MNLGKFRIDSVDTGLFALDGGAMFGVIPKALWAKAYNPGDELNRIPLATRPLLVRWDAQKLLIDTGNGTKLNEKLTKIYNIDKEKSLLAPALQPFGIRPDDITDVILTHLHFDHAGGAISIADGKLVPTFPNARHYVQKEQFLWAQSPNEKDRASFMDENYMPLAAEGMLETLEGAGDVFPGISVLPLFGHTKAMQMVKISDGGQSLLYCADLMPTAAHVPIPYVMGYDNNPLTTIEEKKRILPQAYEEGWILVFEHDAFIQASKLKYDGKGFSVGERFVITE